MQSSPVFRSLLHQHLMIGSMRPGSSGLKALTLRHARCTAIRSRRAPTVRISCVARDRRTPTCITPACSVTSFIRRGIGWRGACTAGCEVRRGAVAWWDPVPNSTLAFTFANAQSAELMQLRCKRCGCVRYNRYGRATVSSVTRSVGIALLLERRERIPYGCIAERRACGTTMENGVGWIRCVA